MDPDFQFTGFGFISNKKLLDIRPKWLVYTHDTTYSCVRWEYMSIWISFLQYTDWIL